MSHAEDRWVPKVHPLDRPAENEDPLELKAELVPGDPDVMLDCILQEFAWMGWNSEQLLSLFHHPGYPVLGQLREFFGDDEVQRRVNTLAAQWGVLRFRETLTEHDDDEDAVPQLVQITMPGSAPGCPTPSGD
jgi:hypothetical protein